MEENPPTSIKSCPQCKTTIAPGLLICPGCQTLVYGKELQALAKEAEQCVSEGKFSEGLSRWRKALELLPLGSRQYTIITEKIQELNKKVDAQSSSGQGARKQNVPPGWLAFGGLGVFLWKFKFLLITLLSKGKLLLLGLTKAQTFFSMFLAFGVYWAAWGWKFALGLILSIYVHEMGHVFALKKFGIPATAPVFIPGVGAFVRLKQSLLSPIEDARVGLAGPWGGLAAAVVCYAVYLTTGWPVWGAIAKVGAWINLFNLLPWVPLDGGRGFQALGVRQKWIAAGIMACMWFITQEGLLVLLFLVGVVNAVGSKTAEVKDTRTLIEYSFLVIIFSLLSKIPVSV